MKLFEKIKIKARALKNEIVAIYYAYQNPELKILPKTIIIITIGYALSPIDLIPDFIPVLGYLDDLIIIPALITLSLTLIPQDIMDEARLKAQAKPVELKKNWFFAIFFILIWTFLVTVIVLSIINHFSR